MNNLFFYLIIVAFVFIYTDEADNHSRAQLEISYRCNLEYVESDHQRYCRNELDGFGHLVDLSQ